MVLLLRFEGARRGAPTIGPADGDDDDIDEEDADGIESDGDGPEEVLPDEPEDSHILRDSITNNEYTFKWTAEHSDVRADQRTKLGFGLSGQEPQLRMGSLDHAVTLTTVLKYFILFIPLALLRTTVDVVDKRGREKYGNQFLTGGRRFSLGLLLSWLGCFFYMMLYEGLPRGEYWNKADDFSSIFPAHNLGEKSGLSRHDFDHILEFWWLPTYVPNCEFTCASSPSDCGYPADIGPDDSFNPIRRWFDALNELWKHVFVPGYLLCIDESMIKWLGRNRCPGWMKVGRKPDSIGHELKTMACATTRIMFSFELQEGKSLDRAKEYVAEYGAQTALTLRMLKRFVGTGVVLIADSWFGSVKTCLLLMQWGIFSVMNVKMSHALFPKKRLLEMLKEKAVGEHVTLTTDIRFDTENSSRQFYGLAQKGPGKMNDKQRKRVNWEAANKGVPLLLVASCSTSLEGEYRCYNSRVPDPACPGQLTTTRKTVTQTKVTALWRSAFNVVDICNRMRTGVTAMYDVWNTNSWPWRDFGESLTMASVNAENAWKFFDLEGRKARDDQLAGKKVNVHRDFLKRLTAELLNNPYLQEEDRLARPAQTNTTRATPADVGGSSVGGNSVGGSRTPNASAGKSYHSISDFCMPALLEQQARCSSPTCPGRNTKLKLSYKTKVCCSTCHDTNGRSAFVCSPISGRDCWEQHVAKAFEAKDSEVKNPCFTPGRLRDHSGVQLQPKQRKRQAGRGRPPKKARVVTRLSMASVNE